MWGERMSAIVVLGEYFHFKYVKTHKNNKCLNSPGSTIFWGKWIHLSGAMISFSSEYFPSCNASWEICISTNWPLSTPPDLFVPCISNPKKQERKFLWHHSHNTTNILVVFKEGFEEKTVFLKLSSERFRGCSKPLSNSQASVPQSIFTSRVSSTPHFELLCFFLAVQLSSENVFLFLEQSVSVTAMRPFQKTPLQRAQRCHWAQWPFHWGRTDQWGGHLSRMLIRLFFFCFCCPSAEQKSYRLKITRLKVFISHLLSALSTFSHYLCITCHTGTKNLAGGFGYQFPEFFWGMHHIINHREKV